MIKKYTFGYSNEISN